MKLSVRKITGVLSALFLSLVFCFLTADAHAEDTLIPDDNLRAALTVLLDGAEPTAENLPTLTGAIDLSGKRIADITGLAHLTAAASLDLSNNEIACIAALEALDSLTSLDITKNHIDLSDGSDAMAVIAALEAKEPPCTVVYQPQKIRVSGIELLPASLTLCPGDTANLAAAITPTDADNQALSWHSGNNAVATVQNGTVTAIAIGTAQITATSDDGAYTASSTITVKKNAISSSGYIIQSGLIKNVAKNTSAARFMDNLHNDNDDLKLYEADGQLSGDIRVKTGMQIELAVGGSPRERLTIIVEGDADGDGHVSISDYTLTRLDILGLKRLEGIYRAAADVDGDGRITISDYTAIRLDILGLKPIGGYNPAAPVPELPPVSNPRIRKFLDSAFSHMGKVYVWGANGPNTFDCSGYVYYCLNESGYRIYRTAARYYAQWGAWQRVEGHQMQPGDLMFFWSEDRSYIGHIGIYLGNDYFIHATSKYGSVIISPCAEYEGTFSHGMRIDF